MKTNIDVGYIVNAKVGEVDENKSDGIIIRMSE